MATQVTPNFTELSRQFRELTADQLRERIEELDAETRGLKALLRSTVARENALKYKRSKRGVV